jgi:hypothetical protein
MVSPELKYGVPGTLPELLLTCTLCGHEISMVSPELVPGTEISMVSPELSRTLGTQISMVSPELARNSDKYGVPGTQVWCPRNSR